MICVIRVISLLCRRMIKARTLRGVRKVVKPVVIRPLVRDVLCAIIEIMDSAWFVGKGISCLRQVNVRKS